MPGVHCEICGGRLVAVSKTSMFMCEHCGIQYPKNKVRRMFFKDAGVDSKAPINEDELTGLHANLKKYFKEENFVDAENTTNRILSSCPDDELGNYYFDILCKMKIDFKIERGVLIEYIGKETIVRVPKLVTAIGNGAFKANNRIIQVVLPEGVISLGHDAFKGCVNLEKVELPSSLAFVGHSCFASCDNLVAISLPSAVNFLGEFAFSHCSKLAKVDISEKITTIGRSTFADCESLAEIKITPHIMAIGCNAFRDCVNVNFLGDIEKVAFIGENAFKGCANMKKVEVTETSFMSNGWEKYVRENAK